MIKDNLYDSLKNIFNPEGCDLVNIYEQNNTIVYGDAENPLLTSNKPLITYLEEAKLQKGKGNKYIEEITEGSLEYAYFYSTRYWIDVIINFYGDTSESQAMELIKLLNNNESGFIDNGLGILSYGGIVNLTELENAEFKNRFAISIKVDYTEVNQSSEQSYLVKQAEFELENKI